MSPTRLRPLRLSMRPPTVVHPRGRFRTGQVAVLYVGLVLAGLIFVVVVVFDVFSNPFLDYACSRPGQQALADREDFVRGQLNEATNFEVATYDCEDGSTAHLAFTAAVTLPAAREAFLAGGTCEPYASAEPEGSYLACGAGSARSFIFLGEGNDNTTSGEVYLDR